MATTEQTLTLEQKELVAVGASVGAGCHPCVSHHLRAAAKAGVGGERLLAAITSAERVNAEAAVAMGDHVREQLGLDVTSPALLSRLEEALASFGAALGANDTRNIERQLRAAAELGASRSQLQQAIETARTVQENATRIHLREAARLLDAVAPAVTATETDVASDAGCGCAAQSEPTAQQTKASGATAGCQAMFERFMGASAPAGTTKVSAATATAAGPCKKEA